jgi:hypothetical protein
MDIAAGVVPRLTSSAHRSTQTLLLIGSIAIVLVLFADASRISLIL